MIRRMSAKVWFITGTSRGFGLEWVTAALERGDRVVATARKLALWEEWNAVAIEAQGSKKS